MKLLGKYDSRACISSLKTELIPTLGDRTALETQCISAIFDAPVQLERHHQLNGGSAPARAVEKLNVASGIC